MMMQLHEIKTETDDEPPYKPSEMITEASLLPLPQMMQLHEIKTERDNELPYKPSEMITGQEVQPIKDGTRSLHRNTHSSEEVIYDIPEKKIRIEGESTRSGMDRLIPIVNVKEEDGSCTKTSNTTAAVVPSDREKLLAFTHPNGEISAKSTWLGVEQKNEHIDVKDEFASYIDANQIKKQVQCIFSVRPARITHRRRGIFLDPDTDVCCICDRNIFEKPGPGVDWTQCPSCGKFHHATCSEILHCLRLD